MFKLVTTIKAESYDFGLELETVPVKAQVEVSTYLMPQIVTGEGNIGFHCEWDNLNRTTTSVHDTMFCTFGVFLDTTSCCCTILYEINNIILLLSTVLVESS